MKETNPISADLIAPCGMNCAICSKYLSYKNKMKLSKCTGCRSRDQICTYIFEKCKGINNGMTTGDAVLCYECDQYPCRQIIRMDNRYIKNYKMSVKDNLRNIKEKGINSFIAEQHIKYRCSRCGGLISIHNRKCFHCDTVTRLVEKEAR